MAGPGPAQGRRTPGAEPAAPLAPGDGRLDIVCAVASWRYGVTLLPVALRPDDDGAEEKVDAVLRARSEGGWELVSAVTARDGSDLLVFRQPAD